MKNLFRILVFTFLGAFPLISCTKEKDPLQEDLTKSISEIESTFNEYNIQGKFEGDDGKPKIESVASKELIDRIRNELNESYTKQISYAKSGGYLVGVFKDNNCGSYAELVINMDCEDRRPASSSSGYIGASEVTPTYKNVILRLCVVDQQYFESTNTDYAIVMLTSNLPSYVSRVTRFFDNENDSNGNWCTYGGQTFYGWFGSCWFGYDTRLELYYYQPTTYHSFPSLGISYYVLGRFGSYQGQINSDDEDTNNSNWCWKQIWNGTGWDQGTYTSSIPNVLVAGGNTTLYFSKVQ